MSKVWYLVFTSILWQFFIQRFSSRYWWQWLVNNWWSPACCTDIQRIQFYFLAASRTRSVWAIGAIPAKSWRMWIWHWCWIGFWTSVMIYDYWRSSFIVRNLQMKVKRNISFWKNLDNIINKNMNLIGWSFH